MLVSDLVGELGKLAPYKRAEEWDNVGLLAGDPDAKVSGVVVAVNLGPEALTRAEKESANVIVCHHPPIFKPISKITRRSNTYLYEALCRGYSVIALHTNFDLASKATSDEIAGKLGFKTKKYLASREADGRVSLRKSPRDIMDLANDAFKDGYGFIGESNKSTKLVFHNVLDRVKETFEVQEVQVVGPGLENREMPVGRLAYSPGSGSSFVGSAAFHGVDVYVCGEVGYHQMLEARKNGLTLMIIGHSYSEKYFVHTVSKWCETLVANYTGFSGRIVQVFETIHRNL